MKRTVCAMLASALLACGATGAATGSDGGSSADADADAGAASPAVPLACDGSLCETTNDSTCTMSRQTGSAVIDRGAVTAALAVLALAMARRAMKRRAERLLP